MNYLAYFFLLQTSQKGIKTEQRELVWALSL